MQLCCMAVTLLEGEQLHSVRIWSRASSLCKGSEVHGSAGRRRVPQRRQS